jgi:hypothetical protein
MNVNQGQIQQDVRIFMKNDGTAKKEKISTQE